MRVEGGCTGGLELWRLGLVASHSINFATLPISCFFRFPHSQVPDSSPQQFFSSTHSPSSYSQLIFLEWVV